MTDIGATEALVTGHLLGGVPELGIAADVEIPRAGVMTGALNAWGLVYPLRFAVQVLLALGPHLRAALIYLRWAALAGTKAEQNNHLDGAIEHIEAAIPGMPERRKTP